MIAQGVGYLHIENILNVTAHRFEQSDVFAAGIQNFLDVLVLEHIPKWTQIKATKRIHYEDYCTIENLYEQGFEAVASFETVVFGVYCYLTTRLQLPNHCVERFW